MNYPISKFARIQFVFWLFILLFFISNCDEKPEFYPEFTNVSIPVDGVLPYFKGEVMDPYWPEKINIRKI